MKLFEYSVLVRCAVVVAAESQQDARQAIDDAGDEGCASLSDKRGIVDVDLTDVRELKVPVVNWEDEAHLRAYTGQRKEVQIAPKFEPSCCPRDGDPCEHAGNGTLCCDRQNR